MDDIDGELINDFVNCLFSLFHLCGPPSRRRVEVD